MVQRGGALYAKGGFLIYSPFTFIVSAGLAYTISPEFQYIYRANETMTTGLFIGLNNGDYFTKAEVTYFNSTFFIMGISVPLVDNTIIIGADLWFGAERETIFGINIQLPFDIAEYF